MPIGQGMTSTSTAPGETAPRPWYRLAQVTRKEARRLGKLTVGFGCVFAPLIAVVAFNTVANLSFPRQVVALVTVAGLGAAMWIRSDAAFVYGDPTLGTLRLWRSPSLLRMTARELLVAVGILASVLVIGRGAANVIAAGMILPMIFRWGWWL